MTYRNPNISLAIAASIAICGYPMDTARASSASVTGKEACLRQHAGDLDLLLTQQAIAPYVQSASEDVETDYDKTYLDEITYSWPSDRIRTMSVSNNEISIPVSNIISLGGLKTYTEQDYYDRDGDDPVKLFQRAHHNLTKEEREKARAALSKSMEKESEATRMLADMIVGAVDSQVTFESVADIADIAAWNLRNNTLEVLIGETEFDVHVDISADNEKNKTVAKKLAQSVLSDCASNSSGG